MKIITILISFALLLSCSRPKTENKTVNSQLTHATKFRIGHQELIVTEPWPGANESFSYPIGSSPQRVVCTSTSHLAYLELLGVEDRLIAFPGIKYISSPKIQERINDGDVIDLGPDGNMNLELLIGLQPDVVMVFDMGTESATIDKLIELEIPIIYNSDYLENSALGRAEWIKFFGALFDKRAEADSIFNFIQSNYDSLQVLVTSINTKPTVFSGITYGDAWFLPGGRNWSASFFKDAGAAYLWESDTTSGWLEISFETVVEKAQTADYWIGTSTLNSLQELQDADDRYMDFDAFKSGNVYNYSKRRNVYGGYDFFELGYARPDLILADMIKIFHPSLLENHETFFFEALK